MSYSFSSCIALLGVIISIYVLNIEKVQQRSLNILIEFLSYIEKSYFEDKQLKDNVTLVDTNKTEYECLNHRYRTRIISRTPLIIYIDNFLSPYEIQHLIELATPLFSQSQINDNNGKRLHDKPYRTSSTAFIDRRETPIVECIEHRFAQFQGNLHPEYVEPLQVVKYTFGQEVCLVFFSNFNEF